jgi:hypothetical protein
MNKHKNELKEIIFILIGYKTIMKTKELQPRR